jgi:predicted HTH domain antitoxin
VRWDELRRQPQQLIDHAQRGELSIVTVADVPVMMARPLGKGIDTNALLIDLAATLFDGEQLSLGLAARIAGLSCSEMVDELGRREIAVIQLEPEELERELAAFDDRSRHI